MDLYPLLLSALSRAVARSGTPMLLSMPRTFRKSNTIKDDGQSVSAGASGKARTLRAAAPRRDDTVPAQLVQEHLETSKARL